MLISDCSTELYRKSDGSRVCAILLGEKLAYDDALGTCKSLDSTLMPITDEMHHSLLHEVSLNVSITV